MDTNSLTQFIIRLRLLLCVGAGFLILSSTSAVAQTPIGCGQLTAGSITTTGQENRYTFSATAGDVVYLRIVTSTNNFTPQMQLLFGTQLLQTTTSSINRTLTQAGTYTIAVRYSSGSSQTVTYQLILQRTKNPCGAVQLSACQTVTGHLSGPADLDAYTFNGTSGQAIKLQFAPLTTNLDLSSDIELYDPDGLFVTSSTSIISSTLTKTGVYTVLVGTNLFDGMAGNYSLTLGNIAVLVTTPNGGEIFLAGTTVPIKWRSDADNPFLSSHDILLSTDSGATFPTILVGGLSSSTQSFNWKISPLLATINARIRVIAKDSAGNFCQDDSDASFTVVSGTSLTPVTYKYDELSRLIQAVYDDGTGITYTYDAAGNRLTEVVAPVPFYRISCNPPTLNSSLGGSATTTCTVSSLNGFSSPVALSCGDTLSGMGCSFNPSTITPPANGAVNSTLTVNVSSSVPSGTYAFQAIGSGGGYNRSFTLRLGVTDFAVACSPSSLTAIAGGNAITTCTVASLNGFNSAVSLSCPNAPAGVTCSFNPATVTPPASGAANSTLTISVATSAPVAMSAIQVAAINGSNTRTANLTLDVQAAPGEMNLLSEDFASGIPGTWSVVDGLTGGGTAATWTTANPGARSIGTPLETPFAIVDSDRAGSGISQDEQLISPTLNASGCNRVILQFGNQFRFFGAEMADVDVSTDGGSLWTNVLRMQGVNDGYPTPNTKSIDITSVIASNPSNVRIRFHYYNATFEWWWAIDNIKVRCLPAFGMLQLSAASYSVSESAVTAQITVNRTGDTSAPATIDYLTLDGTGRQRVDYIISAGTLSFATGETSKSFTVLVVDNVYVDGNRTVNVLLSNPHGAVLGSRTSAGLTIQDNDIAPPTTNPLDNADQRFFVRQHYYDFLNRVPDQGGFDFWTGQITQCGSDQTCLRNKRIDVSNAFYYELEFQQTGSYVYRLYREAFGNNQPFPNPNPDAAHPGEEKKVPLYLPFMTDRARVRGGAQLPQLQLDLANLFVQRNEFSSKYPASLDGPAFVDAVLATIRTDLGVDLTAQRQALINLFNAGGRGNVIYRLADDSAQGNPINNRLLIDAEYNRAFVFTQYAGYLRRNPDMAGFVFWLNQVNSAPLRDVAKQHDMVCSFITSAEYQQRFSSIAIHSNAECPH
jgi:YD repeat-containing protein